MTSLKFDLVLFDCDGVLVDSEPITNGVLRDMLAESGWMLSSAECMRLFIGKAVMDERALIEANTRQPLMDKWMHRFRERRNAGLLRDLQTIDGAVQAVANIHAQYASRIACASGADRFKVELQLGKCGLMPYFKGNIFSGHELPRSKPAPAVYLAAAELGLDARRCAVVEDTVIGVMEGVAAGATVFGYTPPVPGHGHDGSGAMRAAGAVAIFTDMSVLPALGSTAPTNPPAVETLPDTIRC